MNTTEKVKILARITTRGEHGRHFTEIHSAEALAELERDGLVAIERPVHEASGIQYAQQYWSVEVTADGIALVEANPEDIESI